MKVLCFQIDAPAVEWRWRFWLFARWSWPATWIRTKPCACVSKGVILPLEQLLQQALDRYPGAKLLEAELEEKHDVYIYEVELLTAEGVVRELDLDATTGQLLKDKED